MAMIEVAPGMEVRDDKIDGLSVCTTCKGAGRRWHWQGWSDFRVGRSYACEVCQGWPLFYGN